ncbi:MAG: hypothetical protein H6721_00795 [Sandaracinus sp.]|nr:hypothetical protein [Sandaracinus sp.]MCB9623666.1 hypothetical protein [Sandaracinus sp.]MCB9630681.1 hypothetical protein [Sandaracinus sp.]
MGAFFTSVQVRSKDADRVVTALREDAAARGFDEVEDDGSSDRAIFVTEPDEGGWIAVYDLESEGQDVRVLERLAKHLSEACETDALTVLVHDSDTLDMRLFARGIRVDRLEAGVRVRKGDPAKWRRVVDDVFALKRLFARDELQAEAMLGELAALLHVDVDRASTGHRYVASDPAQSHRTLRFRSRRRPAWESEAAGLPRFVAHMQPAERTTLGVGDELRVSGSVTSVGGPGTGVSIVVWGDALEQGLVTLERVELLVGNVRAGARHQMRTPETRTGREGRALWVVDVPEQTIPAGIAPDALGTSGADFVGGTLGFLDAQFARLVHVNLVGRVVRDGEGGLGLGFVPTENRAGACGMQTTLEVGPALRRPLRARGLEGHQAPRSDLLRPLAQSTYDRLLVSVDADRAEVAALVGRLITDLVETLPPGRVDTAVFPAEAARKVKTGRGQTKTLLRGKRLSALVEALAVAPSVSLRMIEGAADPTTAHLAPGWKVEAGLSLLPDRLEPRLSTLSVAVERASRSDALRRSIRARLEQTLDEARALGAVQGAITTMGRPFAAGLEQCDYELVCQIHGPAPTTRAWCTRWLRMPGEVTWLGPSLVAHLDRSTLEAVGTVEEQDGGWLVRTSRDAIDAFEEALAPVLPTSVDAREASRAFYLP